LPTIETSIPEVEEILIRWRAAIGRDFVGYRNHVHRMVHFALAFGDPSEDDRRKVRLAGAFHDLGIWSAGTFDYLAPSIGLAHAYLEEHGLAAWAPEIEAMIDQHHKLRPVAGPGQPLPGLVEVFRRADLVDLSLGAIRFGLPRAYVREVRRAFPNAGFHRTLLRLTGGRLRRHPLDPLPVVKW
jgi:hypothetical protein